MKKTEIDYEKVFQLFVGNDDYNEKFKKPFRYNGYYYATDGCSLIFMPIAVKPSLKYSNGILNQKNIIPDDIICYNRVANTIKCTMKVEIKVSELEKKLVPTMINEKIKKSDICPECEGSGTVDYDYKGSTIEGDCPKCKGTGKCDKEVETENMIVNREQKYKMHDVYFRYYLLNRLVEACNLMNVKTIYKTAGTKNTANKFICVDATILLMPTLINSHEKIITIF